MSVFDCRVKPGTGTEETSPRTVKRWPAAWGALGSKGRVESHIRGPRISAQRMMDKGASVEAAL